jgi:N-acetylglucosamine kinase-like BadF-type ATPase
MILIADSGSTKTDWRLIDGQGKVEQAKTTGFNPYQNNEEEIFIELDRSLKPVLSAKPDKIFYYGAGCKARDKAALVTRAIQKAFPESEVVVDHDLLAAARSLCGNEAGIACILGTGSNSCLYDGHNIVEHRLSLAFILGDEGSGAVMGKMLVKKYLDEELPAHLAEKFKKRYNPNPEEILDFVYKKPFPNRYLSGFSQFLYHNMDDPFIYKMIYDSFSDFFDKTILRYTDYQKYPAHFVGSIAFYYSNILRQVANDKGVVVKNILETPIAGLTLYHSKNFTMSDGQ